MATELYTPQTENGDILGKSEFKRIQGAFNKLTKPGWEDYIVASLDFAGGASGPTLTEFITGSGYYRWAFPGNSVKEGSGDCHIQHSIADGEVVVYPHIHWSQKAITTPGNEVVWKIDCTSARGHGQDAFPAMQTIAMPAQACTATHQHMITENDVGIPIPTLEPDTLILIRIYRDTGDAADNTVDDAFFLRCDFHVRIDPLRTYEKVPPFSKIR